MEARDIIKRPVLTEKSYLLMQENKYTFLVDTRAHKKSSELKLRK